MVDAHPAPVQPRLLLCDVDHTLIETRGVGRAIYERAFLSATGKPLTNTVSISGRTELDIMTASLQANGVEPTSDVLVTLSTALIEGYEAARDELGTRGRALPGAHETLAHFAEQPSVYQSVLTGNLRAVARIKLEVFGLDRYVDLEAGAYGDDDSDRAKLICIAQGRATDRTGVAFANHMTVMIGDTPNDVRAGLTAGVWVLGVATGKTSVEGLRDAGATWMVEDLMRPGLMRMFGTDQ